MISIRRAGLALATAGLGLAVSHPAAAQVIYSDNFSTGAAGTIGGQQPTIDPSNAVYTVLSADNFAGAQNGTSDITKTGGPGVATFALSANNPALVDAFLPYVVTNTGPTVTLTSTYVQPNDATWLSMGFAQNVTSSQFGATGPGPWILVRGNGQYQVFAGPGVNNTLVSNGTGLGTGGGIFSETLNPVSGLLTASFNGTQFYSTTLASLPSINDVFFGMYVDNTNKAGRTISNFSLSAAPEPSPTVALALGVLGLGGLVLTARKRCLSA